MSRFKFKTWLAVVIMLPVCLLVLGIVLSAFGSYLFEREFARAAVWANNMTASVLCVDHQWDAVRLIAMSKDGHYFVVDGLVGSEDSLKELRSKLENPPSYIGPAPLFLNWNVKVETNFYPAIKFGTPTP
jgi:hypothetical protein